MPCGRPGSLCWRSRGRTAASRHFQLLYTPEAALKESAAVPLALVFSHPFDNGFTMEMGKPEAFYVVAQRGDAEPKNTDLMQYLEPIKWAGPGQQGSGLPGPPAPQRHALAGRLHLRAASPRPTTKSSEDKYIQQITKTVVNIGGLPGEWDKPLGLPVEVVPLNKPYANWVGGCSGR